MIPRRLALPLVLVAAVALTLPAAALIGGAPASAPSEDDRAPPSQQQPLLARVLGVGAGAPASAPADDPHGAHQGEHDAGAHQHARERPQWPPAEGEVPASGDGLVGVRTLLIEGAPTMEQVAKLDIAGSGSWDDPFVLEGLHVTNELELKDTDDWYVIRENFIEGTLRLNWNGNKVHVHHNSIRDLRVNENIERVGDATGGLIEANEIGIVGQIRHFDGVFRANVVGPAPEGTFDGLIDDAGMLVRVGSERVVNIDGFSGGVFEDNDVSGYVEMQLHGHHHATCFACHSHNHGDLDKAAGHDHTIRYHDGVFRNNRVTVEEGYAFRYTDTAHAGDDRTATSEPEASLDKPHTHFTRILVADNVLKGGPLVIDVFNADDERHVPEEKDVIPPVAVHEGHRYRGEFVVRGNSVSYAIPEGALDLFGRDPALASGIHVGRAKDARVVLEANRVALEDAKGDGGLAAMPLVGAWFGGDDARPAGIRLDDVRTADALLAHNIVRGPFYGVQARDMPEDATWTLADNAFEDVVEKVDHDGSVENRPRRA